MTAEIPLPKVNFFCLKINPDFSFAVFGVYEQKPKRWYGFDFTNENNPVTSIGSPIDMIGEFATYSRAEEMRQRAEVMRGEFDTRLREMIKEGSDNADD